MPAVQPPVIDLDSLSWDELARLAKNSETEIDSKLLTLGRLTSAALRTHRYDGLRPPADSPLRQAERLAEELEGALGRLSQVIEVLSVRGSDAGSLHLLQRHRDLLTEYLCEFRKTKEHLSGAKEHAELVSSVREEINAYRPDGYLLHEQERIELAQKGADQVISIAYAAQGGLSQQRGILGETGRRMQGMTDTFPVVNQIMGKVRLRRKRDTLIIGGLIAFLLFLTYLMMIRK